MNDEIKKIISDIKKTQNRIEDKMVIDMFEKSVLKIRNPELSYYFAHDIEGADIKAHEQVILSSKDPK